VPAVPAEACPELARSRAAPSTRVASMTSAVRRASGSKRPVPPRGAGARPSGGQRWARRGRGAGRRGACTARKGDRSAAARIARFRPGGRRSRASAAPARPAPRRPGADGRGSAGAPRPGPGSGCCRRRRTGRPRRPLAPPPRRRTAGRPASRLRRGDRLTTRRAELGPGRERGLTLGAGELGLQVHPQAGQNRAFTVTFFPQWGHFRATTIWLPQAGQKRAATETSPWQSGQCTVPRSRIRAGSASSGVASGRSSRGA